MTLTEKYMQIGIEERIRLTWIASAALKEPTLTKSMSSCCVGFDCENINCCACPLYNCKNKTDLYHLIDRLIMDGIVRVEE